jgi:phosphatidylethanolamine/phosphatidyl-N-methylethanolamine N-methyltransferase
MFLKKFIQNPLGIGAVSPSSNNLAQKIAKVVERLGDVQILEMGPGTGSITSCIQHKNPVLIEIDKDFCSVLSQKFPNLIIENNCCIDKLNSIEEATGIVFSIPLTNNPLKKQLIAALNKKYLEGKIKWCVLFTYSIGNPLKESNFVSQERQDFCLLNIPPASIWLYK